MSNINNKAVLASIIPQVGWYGGPAIPGLIVGPPGVAKTRFMEGLRAKLEAVLRAQKLIGDNDKFEMATYVLPQTSPDALEGIAVPSQDRTTLDRLPLADLRRLSEAKFSLLFGDELSSANPETGAAFMTFASDGRAGDLKLHNRCARMFAMNPAECAAAGRELSPPEANRFCWIQWELPLADFVDYLRGGEGLMSHVVAIPPSWEEEFGPRTKLLLAAFLEQKREMANELDRSGSVDMQTAASNKVNPHKAWASQRSWENGMRLAAACMSTGASLRSELVQLAISGCVGDAGSAAFFKWLADANIPDPEDLLADPATAVSKLPPRPDHMKACLEQLALCGSDKSTAERKKQDPMDRWATAVKICSDVFSGTEKKGKKASGNPDAAYASLVMLFKRPPRQLKTDEIAKWPWLKDLYEFKQSMGIMDTD